MSNFPAVYLARHAETAWTPASIPAARIYPLTKRWRVQRTKLGEPDYSA
jgi:broad specificity phosphatase PhoE